MKHLLLGNHGPFAFGSVSVATGGAWTPANLSQLDLWFDSSDTSTITLNGSTVSQWSDKSGNARHISQANATQQPTYITAGFNGKNIMRFDGSNDYLFNDTVGASGKSFLTMIAVFKLLSITNEDLPMGTGATTTEIRSFYRANGSTTVGWVSWGNDVSTSTYSYDVGGTYHIFESWQPQLIPPNNVVIGRDGSFTAYSTPAGLTAMTDGFSVGSMRGSFVGNYYTNMEVGEIVAIYDNISTLDRQRVEGYLAWKWGGL